MRQEIFVDLSKAKKSAQRISAYLSTFLVILGIVFFAIEPKDKTLLAVFFIIGLIGLLGLWFSYFKKVKNYATQPYLILDDTGVKIFNPHSSEYIHWINIKTIDLHLGHGSHPSYYFIETDKIVRLDTELISNDMIITLKRYAEKYGTAKFIY